MYYVPGFSNYLQKIAEPEPYAEDTSGYDAPAFYGYDAPAYYTLPASDYGMAAPQQTNPSVGYDYAPAADYGMVMPQQDTPSVSYDYAPAADYGMYDGVDLFQAYSEPAYQSAPAVSYDYAPAADYGMSAQSAPAYTAAAPQGGMVGPLSSLGYVYGEPGVTYEDEPVTYSPETQAYFDKLNAYIGGRSPTYGAYSWAMPAQSRTFGGNLKAGGVDVLSEQAFADQDRIYTRYTPESIYSPYVSKPVEENALYQFNLPGSGDNYGSTGNVRVSYNTPIALVDNRTGQLVYSGTGFDAAEKVAAMARQLTQEGGSKAKWSIYTAPPGATDPSQFKQVAEETQNKGILGVLGSILPLALSFIPGFQALSLPAKMAAAAGAGGLGAAIAGNDILKGALLSGATAGLVSGTGLDKALGSALQGTGGLGSAAATGLGQKAAEETGDIVVKGLGSLAQAGGTALGQGALNALGNSLITSTGAKVPTQVDTSNLDTGAVPTSVNTGALSAPNVSPAIGAEYATSVGALPTPEPGQIVVAGSRIPAAGLNAATAIAPAVAQFGLDLATNPAQYEQAIQQAQQEQAAQQDTGAPSEPDQIVVAANKLQNAADLINAGNLAGLANLGLNSAQMQAAQQYADQTKDQTVVEGKRLPETPVTVDNIFSGLSGPVVGGVDQATGEIVAEAPRKPPETLAPVYDFGFGQGGAGTTIQQPTLSQPEPTTTQQPKSTLDTIKDIADYMQLAGLGIGAIGSLFGGGQKTAATIANASGLGGLNSTFSAKLPGANIPGLGAGVGGGPRTAADLGQQGMTSPQDYYRYGYGPEQSFFGYVPQGAPNTSKAYTGYAKGGFAVEGPGDGREDKIPAMLSDGEYVMDAETVALLGNGSNKAGADMLDKFRVQVRKHKGRELARGKFSKNAKRPEQYLAGGRS